MSIVSILLIVIAIGVGLNLIVVLPVVMYQSLYKIGADEKVVFYYWGSYNHIRVNYTYYQVMWVMNESGAMDKVPEDERYRVRAGWWHGGWAFGLWPFFLGYKIPTDQFDVPIHAAQVYTSSSVAEIPRVRVEVDATLQFRLSDNPVYLGMVFSLFGQKLEDYFFKGNRDLTNSDQLIVESEGDGSKTYRVKKIALLFYNVLNRPMQEAVRTAATKFTFSTVPIVNSSGKVKYRDIVEQRKDFEDKVMKVLTQDGDTVFSQAKLLQGKDPGDSLLVCNYVGEKVQLSPLSERDSETTKAIDYSFIGRQEGLRQQALEKLRRIGEAEGIEELANRLGLEGDKQRAFLMDVLRGREGSINLSSIDLTDVKDILATLKEKLGGDQ